MSIIGIIIGIILFISALICFFSSLRLLIKSFKYDKTTKFFSDSDLYKSFALIDDLRLDPTLLDRIIIEFNSQSLNDQRLFQQGFELGIEFSKFVIAKELNIPIAFENSPVPSGENIKQSEKV